jgi:hypothetical protein
LPGGLTQFSHGKTSFQAAGPITVAGGATNTDEETVIPHGALSGALANTTGAPVANAFVPGHYLVPIAPPGTYTVSFNMPFSGIGQTAHTPLGPAGRPVHLGRRRHHFRRRTARHSGTFTGRVTTADGLPAAGVVVRHDPIQQPVRSDHANGQYTINVFPGTYKLEFQRARVCSNGPTARGDPVLLCELARLRARDRRSRFRSPAPSSST